MSLQRLIINSDLSVAGFKSVCDLSMGGLDAANNFADYWGGLLGGNYLALLSFAVGAVQASGTITIASTGPTNNQTCTIAGVTFTAKTSGAVPASSEFNISATPATVATSLALAINSTVSLSGVISASAALGVVTVTAAIPGAIGNGLVMANVNLSNTTFVSFAGGDNGTAYSIDLR